MIVQRTPVIVQRKINILEVLSAVNRSPSISKALLFSRIGFRWGLMTFRQAIFR